MDQNQNTEMVQMSDRKMLPASAHAPIATGMPAQSMTQPQSVDPMMFQQQQYQQQQLQMQQQYAAANQMPPEQQAQYYNYQQPMQQPYQQPQQQMAALDQQPAAGGAYPTAVDPELQNQIEKDEKKMKKENQKAVLNVIGPLRDDPDRQRFVVKVYTIVAVQMLITVGATAFVMAYEPAQDWMKDNPWMHYVALGLGIVLLCSLCCCIKVLKRVPVNYIILFLFTFCWTYMVAGFCQYFEPEEVLTAAGITSGMTVGLTFFACCCKMKLTWLWAIAATLSFAIWPLFLFCWVFQDRILYNVLCFLIIILTSIYIIFDTKLIMSKLNLDEYIIGALLLYIDIIQLFMYILSLFGGSSN